VWQRCRHAARWLAHAVQARPALTVALVCGLTLIALGASPPPRPTLAHQLALPVRPAPSGSSAPTAPEPEQPAATGSPNNRVNGGPGGSAQLTGSSGVALTFDDGPDPVNTPRLLDLLKQQKVKATFCVVGFRARDHPDLIRRIAEEGHTLCNHSWRHDLRLARKPPGDIQRDLQATNDAIRDAAPGTQVKYFRAPGGNFTTGVVGIARELGMSSLYWWVDPRDWDDTKDASPQAHISRVAGTIRNRIRPGAIVLAHDNGQPNTITVFQQLLPWLKDRYTLIAMPT
jgi:peptidoglycan/xylan/chitin deacetylase (PgdA/CDA1 family)